MTHDTNAALLVDELRRDVELDGDHEVEALARVQESLAVRALPLYPAERARLAAAAAPRRRLGPRAGLLAALAVGTAFGAGGHAVVSFAIGAATPASAPEARPTPTRPKRAATSAAMLRAASPPVPSAASSSLSAEEVRRDTSTSTRPSPPPTTVSHERGLADELTELEKARHAISAGMPDEALRTLRVHAQRSPSSALVQEREALMVKALVAAGRTVEARAAAEKFFSRYPASTLRATVERAVEAIP